MSRDGFPPEMNQRRPVLLGGAVRGSIGLLSVKPQYRMASDQDSVGVAIACLKSQQNIKPVPGRSVALISCYHLCNKLPLGQRGRVNRLTGGRKAVRDHSMPAQVKSGGKLEPTRRPHRETRPAWSRLDCFKPNPQRLIKGPTATLVRRRCASGAGHRRLVGGKTARCSIRGREPVSRDEWAT